MLYVWYTHFRPASLHVFMQVGKCQCECSVYAICVYCTSVLYCTVGARSLSLPTIIDDCCQSQPISLSSTGHARAQTHYIGPPCDQVVLWLYRPIHPSVYSGSKPLIRPLDCILFACLYRSFNCPCTRPRGSRLGQYRMVKLRKGECLRTRRRNMLYGAASAA